MDGYQMMLATLTMNCTPHHYSSSTYSKVNDVYELNALLGIVVREDPI